MLELQKLEADLRGAVESKQYGEVQRLVVAYCEAARTLVGTLPPGDPGVRDTQRAVEDVLEWSRRMLQSGRESITLNLGKLPRVKRYLQTPPAGGSSFEV